MVTVFYRVATIGYHIIYKIVDTCMVRIFSTPPRSQNSVESKSVDTLSFDGSQSQCVVVGIYESFRTWTFPVTFTSGTPQKTVYV